mmetsp:Transcript_11142/g.17988  ORF Transcript_11142/g.17988 Transcript_11142/m.17988 type:complete len:290 (-) Transcript_11142:48-917(-)
MNISVTGKINKKKGGSHKWRSAANNDEEKDEDEEKFLQIYVKFNGNYCTIEMPSSVKVGDLVNHMRSEIGISDKSSNKSIHLTHRSKLLVNERTLLESGVKDEDEILLNIQFKANFKLPAFVSGPAPSNPTIGPFSECKEAERMQTITKIKGMTWFCTRCDFVNRIQAPACSVCLNRKPPGYLGDIWFSTLRSMSGKKVNRTGDEYYDLGKFEQAAICYRVAVEKKYVPAYLSLAYHLTHILDAEQRKSSHWKEADELVQIVTEKPLIQALTNTLRQDEIRLILSYTAI